MNPWNRPAEAVASQSTAVDAGLRSYMLKVYNYMASALLLTGIVAYFVAQASVAPGVDDGQLALTSFGQAIFLSPLKWLVMLAPLGMVIAIGAGVNRMSASSLQTCFWVFAGLMGLSLSSIFLAYTGASIARTFFITSAMFGGMSILGYTTKRDLTGMGHFMRMGVWGLIVASLVNAFFMHSSALDFGVSVLGVVIFTGLTAYDTQKLKDVYYQVAGGADALARASIMGALSLYLDFINLFVMLLRLTGDRR